MRVLGFGSTFTDFMLYDTESAAVHVHKVRSTPDDPGRALTAPTWTGCPCSMK